MLKRAALGWLFVALLASSSHSAPETPSNASGGTAREPAPATLRTRRLATDSIVPTERRPPGSRLREASRLAAEGSAMRGALEPIEVTAPIIRPSTDAMVPWRPTSARTSGIYTKAWRSGSIQPRPVQLQARPKDRLGALGDRIPEDLVEVVRHFEGDREAGALQADADGIRFSPFGFIPTARDDVAEVRGYAYDFDVIRLEFQGLSP